MVWNVMPPRTWTTPRAWRGMVVDSTVQCRTMGSNPSILNIEVTSRHFSVLGTCSVKRISNHVYSNVMRTIGRLDGARNSR